MPFTADDFDPQLEQALELMPDALGADGAEIRYAINGLLSLTPDGAPILGETPEVKGLWSAAAVWIKEGPGVGRAVAEWMTHGHSEIDVHHSDIARFYPHQRTRAHVRSRTSEAFNKTYGIVHPGEQWAGERGKRLAPMHAAEQAAGAVFFETVGWERPFWYGSNEALLGEYGDRVMPREHEWDARWWSPIINAEHLAMRERAGIVDLSAFAIFDVVGPGAEDAVQGIVVAQADVADGRVHLHPGARRERRLPLRPHRDAAGPRPLPRGHRRRARHGRPQVVRRPPARRRRRRSSTRPRRSPRSGCGARGPATSSGRLTDADISARGLPLPHLPRASRSAASRCWPRGSPTSASWAGSCTCRWSRAPGCGTCCTRPGRPHGAVPVGIGVYGTTGRLEKGYRAYGFELDGERTIVEAGMARPKVKNADFVGREAYLAQREAAPQTVLCTLTVDDHTSASGGTRYMLGGEPILTRDGGTLTDGHGHHPYVTIGRLGAVAGQARADGLPAAGPGRGRQRARRVVHGGALPGDRRLRSTPPRCSTRPTSGSRADDDDQRPGVHQAGARRRGRGDC